MDLFVCLGRIPVHGNVMPHGASHHEKMPDAMAEVLAHVWLAEIEESLPHQSVSGVELLLESNSGIPQSRSCFLHATTLCIPGELVAFFLRHRIVGLRRGLVAGFEVGHGDFLLALGSLVVAPGDAGGHRNGAERQAERKHDHADFEIVHFRFFIGYVWG